MAPVECFAQPPLSAIGWAQSGFPVVCRRPRARPRFALRMAGDAAASSPAVFASPPSETVAETAPISSLRNVSYSIGGVTVIEGVSLELFENEVVAVLGPSGSGKR